MVRILMFPYPQYNSLAFLDPVPTIFILLSILLSLNDFFIFSAKKAHLQIKEKKVRRKDTTLWIFGFLFCICNTYFQVAYHSINRKEHIRKQASSDQASPVRYIPEVWDILGGNFKRCIPIHMESSTASRDMIWNYTGYGRFVDQVMMNIKRKRHVGSE